MIYSNIAEYELGDSMLARQTILDLHKEIERLKSRLEEYQEYVEINHKEIERLNNIINKGIEAINVYQDEKTLSIGYQDLKRIRGILRGNEFDLKMFEEYLQELKGEGSNEKI